MSSLVHLAWWKHKNAERLHLEDEQRCEIIESLNPIAMIMTKARLVIRYAPGDQSPENLCVKIQKNPAWALNLFSVIRRVMFDRSASIILRVKAVRILDDGPNYQIEVVFYARLVRGNRSIRWQTINPSDGKPSNRKLVSYEFA